MAKKNLGELVDSVSKTHKFDKSQLIFLNTSDVLEGKILTEQYMEVSQLKGQAKKTIQNDDILFSEIRPKNKRYAYVNVKDPGGCTKFCVNGLIMGENPLQRRNYDRRSKTSSTKRINR